MRKIILSHKTKQFIFILIAGIFLILPTKTHATVMCPLGFTCTPIMVPIVVCPIGYTCIPKRALPPISIKLTVGASATGTPLSDTSFSTPYTSPVIKTPSPAFASTPVITQGPNGPIAFTQAFTYTLWAGNNNLYISTDPNLAVATSSTGAKSANAIRITASPDQLAGDTTSSFVIPAGGSRTFTVIASVSNQGGASFVSSAFQITKLYYSPNPTITGTPTSYIDFGLNNLQTIPPVVLMN